MLPSILGLGKQLHDAVTGLVDYRLEEDNKGTETLDMLRVVLREISVIPWKISVLKSRSNKQIENI